MPPQTLPCTSGASCSASAGRLRRTAAALAAGVLLLGCLLIFARSPANAAGAPPVDLQVSPATLNLAAGQAGQVVLVVRNQSTDTLRALRLGWLPAPGLVITNARLPVTGLAPGGELGWPVTLLAAGDGLLTQTVNFRLDYIAGPDVPHVAFAALAVHNQPLTPVGSVAGVDLQTSLTSVNAQQPGLAYLLIANKTDVPITVTRIITSAPSFITLVPQLPAAGRPVGPHSTAPITVSVAAQRGSTAGNHLMVFDVELHWREAGQERSGHLFASRPLTLAVLGESAILEAIGVPSFLILPGCLVVLTISLLWKWRRSKEQRDTWLLSYRTPEFYLVAITLSVLAAIIYPFLTGWLSSDHRRQNYLIGYDLITIAQVWLASVLVAIVAYGSWVFLRMLWRRLLAWWARRQAANTPTPGDFPIPFIRKLARQKLAIDLPVVEIAEGRNRLQLLLVGPTAKGLAAQAAYWLVPGITVTFADAADADFKKSVREQLKAEGSLAELARLLEEGKGKADVEWQTNGSFNGPKPVAGKDITPSDSPAFKQVVTEAL